MSGGAASGQAAVITTADALKHFATDVFGRAGMPAAQAAIVADVLVWADLRGVDSHGVARIPMYVRLIDAGDLNTHPAMTTRTGTAAAVLIEADRAAGPVAMTTAMTAAVGKARMGARRRRQPDDRFAISADPAALGGPKGSGLALMIECLTSLVVANPILADALEGTPEGHRHRQNGLTLAIDVTRFGDPQSFRSQVDRLIKALKARPRDPAVVEILMPGERGSRTFEQRRRSGIPIPPALLDQLKGVADRFDVALFPSAPGPREPGAR